MTCKDNPQEISLEQILQAREARAFRQKSLLASYHVPLICFTMNIAGPVKNSPLIERAFHFGIDLLEQHLPTGKVLYKCVDTAPTGCEAMYAVDADAASLKDLCIQIEENTPLGRLFDMDVLDMQGIKLKRKNQRGCIVCGAPGRGCAAGRLHSVDLLQTATKKIIEDYLGQTDRHQVAQFAVTALLEEVHTTPKPGLVDRRNSGSHTDMDIDMFIASAKALEPYFRDCIGIGQDTANQAPEVTFSLLRKAGLSAEETMYRVTGGVNTHKGMIYSMGILCGALGRLWDAQESTVDISAVFAECAKMAQAAACEDFEGTDRSTAGLRLYQEQGLTGIRGEVADGFPSVEKISLPAYEDALSRGMCKNEAGLIALLHLIVHVEDTNLYHRGGKEGAAYAKETARDLLPYPTTAQLEEMDDAFIARNLSPGGCADLLAVTYFISNLKRHKTA